jgi:hypothetical protein
MAHRWSVQDDIVALYLYRFGEGDIGTLETLGETRGMGKGSLRMRVQNFQFLASGQGLSHPSKQSKAIYRRHRNTPREELRQLAMGE